MIPAEHLRKLSPLGEAGTLEEKNFYGLATRMTTGGYGFLQPESMEAVARRQELVQKQNLARMEMEMGTIFQQRETGKAQQKGLMGLGLATPFLYQHGIPTNPLVFQGRSRLSEVHLPNDVYIHRSSLDDLHGNTRLRTTGPYPLHSCWQKEKGRRLGRRPGNHKASASNARSSKNQEENRNPDQTLETSAAEKEDKKDFDIEPHHKYEPSENNGEPAITPTKNSKEHEHSSPKPCEEHGWSTETSDSSGGNEKDSCHSSRTSDEKYLLHSPASLDPLPHGFPVLNNSSLLPPGIGDLFLNGEDLSSAEDIRKWAVDDVFDFITGLPGCSDYAQIFRDHAIDGETLPLLTEEHLLDTMGLKLGPVLKIRAQTPTMMIINSASEPEGTSKAIQSICGKNKVAERSYKERDKILKGKSGAEIQQFNCRNENGEDDENYLGKQRGGSMD
ncbi:sterile alpha motif domain-containing protein 7 [Monodelphis domestica]|uniref:sterile alpha motif domain-containing protein 7 n=1 Tax=Monodelphis domestica TaxID=13616 RepID=UPI0024E1FACE|nr:sterile alpha motif domain-containing protein 7 [Monodelphis domestica]